MAGKSTKMSRGSIKNYHPRSRQDSGPVG